MLNYWILSPTFNQDFTAYFLLLNRIFVIVHVKLKIKYVHTRSLGERYCHDERWGRTQMRENLQTWHQHKGFITQNRNRQGTHTDGK